MTFIDYHQKIFREIIKQAVGFFSGFSVIKKTRIVLYSFTVSGLFHHLDIIECALFEPVRLDKSERGKLALKFFFYGKNCSLLFFLRNNKVAGRKDIVVIHRLNDGAADLLNFTDTFNLVPEQLNADNILIMARNNIDDIAPHPEFSGREIHLIAFVLDINQRFQQIPAVNVCAGFQLKSKFFIMFRIPQTIDRRDRSDDNDITPGEYRCRCREAHPFNLRVYGGVFLDILVFLWKIGFRLIVVVV